MEGQKGEGGRKEGRKEGKRNICKWAWSHPLTAVLSLKKKKRKRKTNQQTNQKKKKEKKPSTLLYLFLCEILYYKSLWFNYREYQYKELIPNSIIML